jgi:hypothetical protein
MSLPGANPSSSSSSASPPSSTPVVELSNISSDSEDAARTPLKRNHHRAVDSRPLEKKSANGDVVVPVGVTSSIGTENDL